MCTFPESFPCEVITLRSSFIEPSWDYNVQMYIKEKTIKKCYILNLSLYDLFHRFTFHYFPSIPSLIYI